MPSIPDRNQTSTEEIREFSTVGPFSGIQSELPLTEIEQYGFSDINNLILRRGYASMRPGFTALPPLPSPSNEPILGIADFYNASGQNIQCIFTPTRLIQWNNGAWTPINGPGFGGSSNMLFQWDSLNYNLCFSQGVDKIWMWDGLGTTYQQTSAAAPPARYLAEVDLHLIAVNPAIPQRYYWSGIGDPTDWSSFSSGLDDNVSNLGPINNILKLGQYGFGFHQKGIIQVIPTGVGTAPFDFVPLLSANQGLVAPYSLDLIDDMGEEIAVFLGVDNVYMFDGTSMVPIGDRPLGDGSRKRIGARTRILNDVKAGDYSTIYGLVTYSINGLFYRAYWLVIPGISVWVYNFDEANWTRFTYNQTISSIGPFFSNQLIRIADLVGAIYAQSWTPATIEQNNPFPGVLLGFNNGVAGYIDFTNYSEVAGSIISGKIIFGDRRHKHTTKKYRLAVQDQGQATYTLTITNEKGVSESHQITIGTGSGDVLSYVQEFKITGLRIQWQVTIPANQPGAIVEFAPYFDVAGEQRGGFIDN